MYRIVLLSDHHGKLLVMPFLFGTSIMVATFWQFQYFFVSGLGLKHNQVSNMSENSVDLVRCGICMERFNQDDRKPKFLQCYHTYCSNCLTKFQEKVTVFSEVY
jgi:hypothetical protein